MFSRKTECFLGMVACTYNPSTQEAKARELHVLGQSRLQSKTLISKEKKRQRILLALRPGTHSEGLVPPL
jgi:hypothetical protein